MSVRNFATPLNYDDDFTKFWHRVAFGDPWSSDEYVEAMDFCEIHIKGRWARFLRGFYFEDPAEAMIFKLKYG